MDEIFHVPQAQQYCRGDFKSYDSKITTPPGLYLISYALLWLRDKFFYQRDIPICDIVDLRGINHLIAILNFALVILIQLITSDKNRKHCCTTRMQIIGNSWSLDLTLILLNSIAIATLPPLFLFYSLYYTDIGSLFFTLLVYYLSLIDEHVLASICGLISVMFRQTNIVWIFFITGSMILRNLEEHYRGELSDRSSKGITKNDNSKQRFLAGRFSVGQYKQTLAAIGAPFFQDIDFFLRLFKDCLPYGLLGILFVVFVYINKGIVLGDKEAHQPKLHLAQILYFLGFCSVFGASWIFNIRLLRRFLYFTIRNPLTTIVTSLAIIYLISFDRYAHPYLLADNRHITFYIWRRVLDRHNSYVPYMLTPLYLAASFSIWHQLRSQGWKRIFLFLFCSISVIVPNGLLELRYFIVPYTFLRLSAKVTKIDVLLEIGNNILINIALHYLFLNKTFRWSDSQDLQRIMW